MCVTPNYASKLSLEQLHMEWVDHSWSTALIVQLSYMLSLELHQDWIYTLI